MADDTKVSLKKILIDHDGKEFFLYTRYKIGESFHINLFNVKNSEAYNGDFSEVNLRTMAAARRATHKDFLSNTVCALMWDDKSEIKFSYSFEKDAGDVYFRWAKIFESEDMKINLGRVKVSRFEFASVIETVLSQVSLELRIVSLSLEKTKLELEESNKEKEKSKDIMRTAIKVKEDMEKELYSKFILVLNEKKEKIRKLKGQVADSTSESANDHEDLIAKGRKRTMQMPKNNHSKRANPHVVSTSEDEASECTDEDIFSGPGPSTSHQPAHNSSLLLDDDYLEDVCPVQQPRQRHPRSSRKTDKLTVRNENKDESRSLCERGEDINVSINSMEDLLNLL